MNTLPRLLPSLPLCYQDGSFQVMLRNADSVAVFWDLPVDPALAKTSARLCLRIASLNKSGEFGATSPQVLILHHEAGYAFVPLLALEEGCEFYRFTLGWDDGVEFQAVAEEEVEMPDVSSSSVDVVKSQALEGGGFHPLSVAAEQAVAVVGAR
ncbi:MAG: hypothetical protein L3J39_08975 [Verrucomicrobiales bacterium]|nr:hypothetical protein [Verrucomicrobiales bacterium]